MDDISKSERATQRRVIALFRDELGYDVLGEWSDRENNRQVEDGLLTNWLTRRGHGQAQISIALHKLHTEADTGTQRALGLLERRGLNGRAQVLSACGARAPVPRLLRRRPEYGHIAA